jgi:hypothetical protein
MTSSLSDKTVLVVGRGSGQLRATPIPETTKPRESRARPLTASDVVAQLEAAAVS